MRIPHTAISHTYLAISAHMLFGHEDRFVEQIIRCISLLAQQ